MSNQAESKLRDVALRADGLVNLVKDHQNKNDSTGNMSYLDAKTQLQLNYLILLVTYLRNKFSSKASLAKSLDSENGKSEKDSEINPKESDDNSNSESLFRELYRIRLVLKKMRFLDSKLKYSIEKILESGNSHESTIGKKSSDSTSKDSAVPAAALRQSIFADDNDEEMEVDEIDDEDDDDIQNEDTNSTGKKSSKNSLNSEKKSDIESSTKIYQPPKIGQVEYSLENAHQSETKKAQHDLERRERKLMNSQFFSALRETAALGDSNGNNGLLNSTESTPILGTNSGLMVGRSGSHRSLQGSGMNHDTDGSTNREAARLRQKIEERTKFEEENMTRVRLNKNDKKEMKRLKQLQMNRSASGNCVSMNDILADVNSNFGANRFSEYNKAKTKLGVIKGAKKNNRN